ncbi:MAG: ribosomal protein S18 acetylase RimI-like enzyme [Saprospiraceae bacterium]|jgi:ribosomal protein S18 acetylase RimI-like enzyme
MTENITISDKILLQRLKLSDQSTIFTLMKKIYPPSYAHLWPDGGDWYINKVYGQKNFEKDILDINGAYFFVVLLGEIVGILFLQYNKVLEDFPDKKALKLSKIYLDSTTHGNGIGKKLIRWINEEAVRTNCETVWLEAMDTQEQAIRFYEKCGFKISSKFRLNIEMMHVHLKGMYRMYMDSNKT